MLMLTWQAFQNTSRDLLFLTFLHTQLSKLNELPCSLAVREREEKNTIHRKHENPPLSKSGNNTLLSVRPTQKPLRCTLLFLRFSEKASARADDVLWFMPWGHSIIEQWPESFHRTKRAAGEPLNGKMLSLIAGNMNEERPNLFSRVQYLCEVFVGHYWQINTALIKGHKHLIGKERDWGEPYFAWIHVT